MNKTELARVVTSFNISLGTCVWFVNESWDFLKLNIVYIHQCLSNFAGGFLLLFFSAVCDPKNNCVLKSADFNSTPALPFWSNSQASLVVLHIFPSDCQFYRTSFIFCLFFDIVFLVCQSKEGIHSILLVKIQTTFWNNA